MSSPLDRIEAAAKATYWHGDLFRVTSADVLALVNVAKAAEALLSQPIWDIDRSELRDALSELNR